MVGSLAYSLDTIGWLVDLCGCLADRLVVLRCFPGNLAASLSEVGHFEISLLMTCVLVICLAL